MGRRRQAIYDDSEMQNVDWNFSLSGFGKTDTLGLVTGVLSLQNRTSQKVTPPMDEQRSGSTILPLPLGWRRNPRRTRGYSRPVSRRRHIVDPGSAITTAPGARH